MSQMYQIKLKQSVQETRRLRDRARLALNLTDILPPAEMLALLRQELEREGFVTEGSAEGSAEGARCARQGDDGVKVTVDLEAREVEISLERDFLMTAEAEGVDRYNTDRHKEQAQARLAQRLQREAHQKIDQASGAHQEALSMELEQRLEAHRAALNHPIQRTYAEAFKIKAGQLGQIIEMHDSREGGQYELFIKIRQ